MTSLLSIDNLSLSFSGIKAVQNVSFEVPQGAIVGLIGPNGAGKSSLLNCLSRLYEPDSGSVTYDGQNLLSKNIHDLAPMGIMRTFQNLELFNDASALENVVAGCMHKFRPSLMAELLHTPAAVRARRQAYATAENIMSEMDLAWTRDTRIANLSFGVQKRLELARAMAGEPRLLLLDEPAAGMNPEESLQLGKTIQNLRQEKGVTVVMVEHDMRLVMEVCDHIVVLVYGQKMCEGPPAEIRNNPQVIEVYLGEEDGDA